MRKLSEIYKELGIAFKFPIEIKDVNGRWTYFEESMDYWESIGYWQRWEYDAKGKITYYEKSNGYWSKHDYDDDGNETYYESSKGIKRGNPKSAKAFLVLGADGMSIEHSQ